jgi:hypothetical protein
MSEIHNSRTVLLLVKQSHYIGFQEVEAHKGGKVVSPTHRPPLPPGIPGTHFC